MVHGNMINIKSLIQPLVLAGVGMFLFAIVLLDIFEDSSDPEYTTIMQVLPADDTLRNDFNNDEIVIKSSPVNNNTPLLSVQLATRSQKAIPKMQVGYAEIEYALRLVKLDSFGQLILNANTEASLSRSVARLPADLSEAQIIHIKELIQTSLPGEAGNQVADVFTKYYRYKVAENDLVMSFSRPDTIDVALEQFVIKTDLRYEMMGDAYAEKLFGEQQLRAEYHLESEVIRRDGSISAEQKNEQLGLLKTKAQDNGLAFSSPSSEVQQLNNDVNKMRADGQDEAMIQDRREQLLGKAAADQLSLMESQQNDWQLRYQKFDQEKAFILAAALDNEEQEQQLDHLFRRHYSAEELPGAKAYDQKFTR